MTTVKKTKRMSLGSVRIADIHKAKLKRLLVSIDKSWKWFVLGLPCRPSQD